MNKRREFKKGLGTTRNIDYSSSEESEYGSDELRSEDSSSEDEICKKKGYVGDPIGKIKRRKKN